MTSLCIPSSDAAVLARCAWSLHRTGRVGTGPIDANLKPTLFSAKAVNRPLACRAGVLVGVNDIDEVRLVESAFCPCIGCHGLGHKRGNPGILTSLETLAAVAGTVGDDLQLSLAHRIACSQDHWAELCPVAAVVRDLMGNDQVVLGIYRGLHVVAACRVDVRRWDVRRAGFPTQVIKASLCRSIACSLGARPGYFTEHLRSVVGHEIFLAARLITLGCRWWRSPPFSGL